MTEKTKQCMDRCPKCGSVQPAAWRDIEFYANMVFVRYTCHDCGLFYTEDFRYEKTWWEE